MKSVPTAPQIAGHSLLIQRPLRLSLVLVETFSVWPGSGYRLSGRYSKYAEVERAGVGNRREPLRQRHAQYFLAIAERAEPELLKVRPAGLVCPAPGGRGGQLPRCADLGETLETGEAEVALRAGRRALECSGAGQFAVHDELGVFRPSSRRRLSSRSSLPGGCAGVTPVGLPTITRRLRANGRGGTATAER